MQAVPDAAAPSQKACEIVEEAAAEAGLIAEDTARLVKVPLLSPPLHALPQRCGILKGMHALPQCCGAPARHAWSATDAGRLACSGCSQ